MVAPWTKVSSDCVPNVVSLPVSTLTDRQGARRGGPETNCNDPFDGMVRLVRDEGMRIKVPTRFERVKESSGLILRFKAALFLQWREICPRHVLVFGQETLPELDNTLSAKNYQFTSPNGKTAGAVPRADGLSFRPGNPNLCHQGRVDGRLPSSQPGPRGKPKMRRYADGF